MLSCVPERKNLRKTRRLRTGNSTQNCNRCVKRDVSFLFDVTVRECVLTSSTYRFLWNQRSGRDYQIIGGGTRCSILLIGKPEDESQNRCERQQHAKTGSFLSPQHRCQAPMSSRMRSTFISLSHFRVSKSRLLSSKGRMQRKVTIY